mmetsp:Transcript_29566/g.86113  ORF Transcript_29566/g.86113 Transcript_29566/m.86113 type:complete len:283 (+) Transcript_29566:761-1609(+)
MELSPPLASSAVLSEPAASPSTNGTEKSGRPSVSSPARIEANSSVARYLFPEMVPSLLGVLNTAEPAETEKPEYSKWLAALAILPRIGRRWAATLFLPLDIPTSVGPYPSLATELVWPRPVPASRARATSRRVLTPALFGSSSTTPSPPSGRSLASPSMAPPEATDWVGALPYPPMAARSPPELPTRTPTSPRPATSPCSATSAATGPRWARTSRASSPTAGPASPSACPRMASTSLPVRPTTTPARLANPATSGCSRLPSTLTTSTSAPTSMASPTTTPSS